MTPPAWAYQVDSFDPPPDEELVCSICRGIFCDPVRSPCNHVYCRKCIFKWLESNRNCPICRKRTYRYDIQEVVPLIKNMIMKLTLKCHNLERGCLEKFTLEGCEAHVKECMYQMIRCKNKPCKKMVLRRDIKDHELRDCSHRYIMCKKCNLKITPAAPQKHECIKALQKCLKDKMEVIKKKTQKIKDLKKEVKNLKENSAASSRDSVWDEPFVDFRDEMSSIRTSSDIVLSSISSESWADFDVANEIDLVDSTSDILGRLRQDLSRNFSPEQSLDLDDSIEVPRSSSPQYSEIITDEIFSSSPRRPPKRRLPALIADYSSSDDASNEALDLVPSPKRAWSHIQTRSMSVNPAPETVAGPSSVATTSAAAASGSYYRTRSSVKSGTEPSVSSGGAQATRSSGTFERTIALLSQYNLESDPEWQPTGSDSSLENPLPSRDGYITSSDESSLSESDSDDSVLPPPSMRLFDDVTFSSDDDPDDHFWMNY